jgi:hypothetical protein
LSAPIGSFVIHDGFSWTPDAASKLHRLVVAGVRMRTLYQGNRHV